MSAVTAFHAKLRFGELLDRVVSGEEVVITRHDKPVARIVPEGKARLENVKRSVSELRELRAAMAKRRGNRRISKKEIRSAIDKGRP
ncbi:MAG: hypothetical protein A2289_25010 [Deltaproteobacteria bacterium RIFOXYA12_FULL_58_15]|nr:MAG: hypothetical protein A2289_25010 [Deltaproteobacteria bacterium RIFOXYA12_FULL_58_15]OGR11014.1 MAG: hypothetical protein A2341_11550 [Deltaproteobacteria bacterium RIFOXYB12_FULL_58_9]